MVSWGGKGPSADHVYPPVPREFTLMCYTPFAITKETKHSYTFLCSSWRGSLPFTQLHRLLQKATGKDWLPPLSIRPHSGVYMRMTSGALSGRIHPFCLGLELSHLQALPPEQRKRHPMQPRWTFGIWIHVNADSQLYPPTSLESLACKRGNTVTDIFRKGMHM